MIDLIETAPRMDVSVQDMAHVVEELRASHAISSPLLQRCEQRQAAHTYLQGLLATWPRQSIEPMVRTLDGTAPKAVRAMQSLITAGQWHDAQLWHQHWRAVVIDLGDDDGVLMVDRRDVPTGVSHLLHTR